MCQVMMKNQKGQNNLLIVGTQEKVQSIDTSAEGGEQDDKVN